MNATSITAEGGTSVASGDATLLGLRPLIRKDISEWLRGKRAWVTALVVTPILGLTAANGWINHWVLTSFPTEAGDGAVTKIVSMAPADNFMAAIGTQFSLIAAVFATMSLIVAERDSGTLAWTASKPVSRLSIWLSKWITASAILFVAAVLIPVVVTAVIATALYGPLDLGIVLLTIVGLQASVILFTAIGLAAGAYARSQAVIVAVGLAALFVPSLVASLFQPINDFLPTSIFGWVLGVGLGQGGSLVTPVAWLVSIVAIVALAARQMRRMEF
jgi:ABC-type transport system involved in multi-copper enzyme maturation permease subunit